MPQGKRVRLKFEAWVGGSQNESEAPLSWNEEELAGGEAGFEVAVGVRGIGERVGVLETELERAVGDGVEDGVGAEFEFFAGGDVVVELGAGDEERAEAGELDEVEGRDCTAGGAEEDEGSARAKDFEGLVEGGFADGVVDGVEALGRLLSDPGSEVFLGVEDDFIGSGGAGESGFFFGGDGGVDVGSEGLRHLREEEADASGTGVDENFVVGTDGVGGVGEIVGGHALEHGSGGLLEGDGFGNLDEAVGGSYGQLRVGSGDGAPGDAVASFDGGDLIADGDDGSGGLLTGDEGQFGGVAAFTEVDVDEVDARGLETDERFSGTWGWGGKIAEGKDFGTAGGQNLNGLHAKLDAGGRGGDFLNHCFSMIVYNRQAQITYFFWGVRMLRGRDSWGVDGLRAGLFGTGMTMAVLGCFLGSLLGCRGRQEVSPLAGKQPAGVADTAASVISAVCLRQSYATASVGLIAGETKMREDVFELRDPVSYRVIPYQLMTTIRLEGLLRQGAEASGRPAEQVACMREFADHFKSLTDPLVETMRAEKEIDMSAFKDAERDGQQDIETQEQVLKHQ
jgi:hypothetical protein